MTVPKVSIDGQSHVELLLMAIGSGITAAIVIIMILIAVIKSNDDDAEDKRGDEHGPKVRKSGEFVMKTKKSTGQSSKSSPSQRTSLMFKFFGKSLKTFDIEQPSPDWKFFNNCEEKHDFYRQNILDSLTTIENSLAISCIHFFDAQNMVDKDKN